MNSYYNLVLRLAVSYENNKDDLFERARNDRGEGVISMALAILIVAFLGVAAWLAFKGILDDTANDVKTQVNQIGG
ncbi:MAG: hypothetical protein V3V01_15105 [Acidimicrobiales bacterium]